MQQPAPAQPSPTQSSFAGLLASLASPPPATAEDETLWSSSDLGEDVAALSYEQALRAHARYRPLDRSAEPAAAAGDGSPAQSAEEQNLAAAEAARRNAVKNAVASMLADTTAELRTTSVTIRLSKAESTRLRQRAAEAGMTISTYLRSCALEAESLRAQVKQALAEMKAGAEPLAARTNERAKAHGNKLSAPRSGEGVRLARVFGHIGRLWLGVATGKSA